MNKGGYMLAVLMYINARGGDLYTTTLLGFTCTT